MRQVVRFVLVGGINTVWGYVVIFSCMYFFAMQPEAANVIGYGVALFTSYLMHRFFTFQSRNRKASEFSRFILVFVFSYTLNLLAVYIFYRHLHFDPYASQLLAGVIYVIVSYLLNKALVFRSRDAVL